MSTDSVAALAAAIEALVLPPQGPAACAPIMFGHWPGGKSFDEWFTADAVVAADERVQVSFDDGQDVLTIERPGRWWLAEYSIVVASADRVRLRTERAYPQWARPPGAPQTFARLMDYRTVPGAVIDREGRRARWYPPEAPPLPARTGARRAPALELQLLWPAIRAATAGADQGRD